MRLFTRRGSVSSPAVWSQLHTVLAWSILAGIALIIATITPTNSFGQSYYGGLRGIIHDPGGAVVPDAKVALIDEATNLTRSTTSIT